MIGFEELVLKCLDARAREHIQDAIKCYQSGSYRAAIVTAYIAVCFDLIEKMKQLAASGDPEAISKTKHLENLQVQQASGDPNAIKGLLKFERDLLELFRDKFEFFGVQEFEELSRFRHDRNRCAHPTFLKSDEPYHPSAELARLHLKNAIDYVLSQPPTQGKAALANLQAVVTSSYFPTQLEQIVLRLRGSELGNPRPSLVKAFVADVLFGAVSPGHAYFQKTLVTTLIKAVIEIDRATALPWAVEIINKILASPDGETVRMGTACCLVIPEVADLLNNASKATIKRVIEKPPTPAYGNLIRRALDISWLRADALKLIRNLNPLQISKITTPMPEEIITQAAILFSNTKNWSEANSLSTLIAIPNAAQFSESDLRNIFHKTQTGEADLRGSIGFREFIAELYKLSPLGTDKISELLLEYELNGWIETEPFSE